MVFSWFFRPFPRQREPNASGNFYGASSLPGRPHAGVSPGEFTGSWWGLAPKKSSSEEVGLAVKGRALEVSSEDCVEGEVSSEDWVENKKKGPRKAWPPGRCRSHPVGLGWNCWVAWPLLGQVGIPPVTAMLL